MYPNFSQVPQVSILLLVLVSLTGCGEKRVHVATVSGAPGEELALEATEANADSQIPSGLNNASLDESALLSETNEEKGSASEPLSTSFDNEPINLAHEPIDPVNSDPSFLSGGTEPEETQPTPAFSDHSSPTPSLDKGQDFSAQSSSTTENHLSPASTPMENFQESSPDHFSDSLGTPSSEDSSVGLQDTLAGEGLEPIPDTLQIAKVEPSESRQNQMNRLQEEELARKAELQDVFFQFDSWSLSQEGKQALERAHKWFEQKPSSNLIIEGHADQRGTQAYNLILGKKRAVAVQDYLVQLGVETSRLSIISYGKDKPFCQDVTEACHQLNRRGHLLVQTN